MTLHRHQLTGCSPTPLAHYLKAVGVLRLVSGQLDSVTRGFWKDEAFSLITKVSRDELVDYFLHHYRPTPLIAPWNGGSGFFPRDRKDGIDAIAGSTAPRFAPYREAIAAGRALVHGMSQSPKNVEKYALLAECRRRWRGPLLDWLNAALVLVEEGDPAYPALLGTGGNDGRLDFTNNFMQRLSEMFDCGSEEARPRSGTAHLLGTALFSERHPGLQSVAIGQFNPGGAGGANSSTGFGGGSLVNPWDFVLMLEGAVAFASGAVRRLGTEQLPQAAAPFAMYPSSTGFASGVDGEKSRGEQWMPLWERPLAYRELVALIGEGRCQLGARSVRRPLDMARAIGRLGIARGISAFQRYGYIERNGQANLATPLGRWGVPTSPTPFQELLDEIEDWVDRLRQKAGGKGAPAAIGRAARRCENAMMNCCRENSAARWRELLICLGGAEAALIRSPGFTASAGLQPLAAYRRGLSPTWLIAASADSRELRLALALAGGHGIRRSQGDQHVQDTIRWDEGDPVRRHFLPLEQPDAQTREGWRPRKFACSGERLAADPAVVCTTGEFERDAIALVRRRLIEAHRSLHEFLPLTPVPGTGASLCDLRDFVGGEVNSAEVLAIARALMALDWKRFIPEAEDIHRRLSFPSPRCEHEAADAVGVLGLLKLCHHWAPIPLPVPVSSSHLPDAESGTGHSGNGFEPSTDWIEHTVRSSPSIFTRLAHGDLSSATRLAVRRLKISGLRPHLAQAIGDPAFTRRLTAALVFPVERTGISRLARRLVHPHFDRSDHDPAGESNITASQEI